MVRAVCVTNWIWPGIWMCTLDWPVETADTSNPSEPADYFQKASIFTQDLLDNSNIIEGTYPLNAMSWKGYLKVLFERWAHDKSLPNISTLECSCFIILILPNVNVKQNSILLLLQKRRCIFKQRKYGSCSQKLLLLELGQTLLMSHCSIATILLK